MIINESTLGDLCARVARGDEQARCDFDRHVLPVVEAIAGRWLSQQATQKVERRGRMAEGSFAPNSTTESVCLLPKVAGAICARMVAQAGERRMRQRRRCAPRGPKLAAGETLSALIDRHTVSRLVPWPA
jgi:hypothetical protein